MVDTFVVSTVKELMAWDWAQFEPHYTALEKVELTEATISDWLKNWTAVSDVRDELYNRLYVATSVDTADATAQERFDHFMEISFFKFGVFVTDKIPHLFWFIISPLVLLRETTP